MKQHDIVIKSIIADKQWILRIDGEKIASIHKVNDNFTLTFLDKKQKKYATLEEIASEFGCISVINIPRNANIITGCFAHGYPTHVIPHNIVWDIKHNAAIYTETKKSKTLYAAGYYKIESKVIFCPRFLLINRRSYCGPFKTSTEII